MAVGTALAVIGALTNIISSATAKGEQPSQINPLTDQRLADLQTLLSQYSPQFEQLGAQATTARQNQTQAANQMNRISGQAEQLTAPGANDWFDQYLGNIPEYLQVAEKVRDMAMEQYGRDLSKQTQLQLEQAKRAASDATAGQGFSGAAAQAAGQAAAQVIGQAGLQRSQMASDIFNQTAQNQMAQGQNLAFQDQQMQFQNALSQLSQALSGYQATGNQYASIGQNALAQQSNVGSMLQAIQGNIQDIMQPVYSSPTYTNKFAGAGTNIAAAGQAIDASQWQQMMAEMLNAQKYDASNYTPQNQWTDYSNPIGH